MTQRACSLVVGALTVVCVLAAVPAASADPISFVGSANVDLSNGGVTSIGVPGNGVNLITGGATAGTQFFNLIASNTFGTTGEARLVGANLLSSYIKEDGTLTLVLFNGLPVVEVLVLQGNVGASSLFGSASGRLGLFTSTAFSLFDPATWGATITAGTALLTPIAVWDLKSAEVVVDNAAAGGPGVFNLAANQVNQISGNITVSTAEQGFMLFRETLNPSFAGPGALSGNGFVTVVSNPVPAGYTTLEEGLVDRLDESYRIATGANTSFISGGLSSAGFLALNTIACQLGGLTDLDAAISGCQGFGNGFVLGSSAGDGRSFNPSTGNPTPNTGDMLFTMGTSSSPTVEAVFVAPEPASIILILTGGVAAGARAVRRRLRAKQI